MHRLTKENVGLSIYLNLSSLNVGDKVYLSFTYHGNQSGTTGEFKWKLSVCAGTHYIEEIATFSPDSITGIIYALGLANGHDVIQSLMDEMWHTGVNYLTYVYRKANSAIDTGVMLELIDCKKHRVTRDTPNAEIHTLVVEYLLWMKDTFVSTECQREELKRITTMLKGSMGVINYDYTHVPNLYVFEQDPYLSELFREMFSYDNDNFMVEDIVLIDNYQFAIIKYPSVRVG